MFHVKKSVAAGVTGLVGFAAGLGMFAACDTDSSPPPSQHQPAPEHNPAPEDHSTDSPPPEEETPPPSDDNTPYTVTEFIKGVDGVYDYHDCWIIPEGYVAPAGTILPPPVYICPDSPQQQLISEPG